MLRARISQLEAVLFGGRFVPPVELRLTGSEAAVVAALYSREHCTKDAIMAALYRNLAKDEAEIKIVDVFICKVRKKLKPFGIEITTIWGQGYAMPAASKAIMRSMLSAKEAA